MPYTPVELRHVRVQRAFLGYNRSAVEALLKEVAENFETAWRERHELADHVESVEAEVAQLRHREHALTQTLLAAEQAAAHVKEQAQREAELIVAEANTNARALTREAETQCRRLEAETRRVEAILRGALGMLQEGVSGADELSDAEPGWPDREAEILPESEEAQPQLQKVSGGFDWGA